ncbi:M64 family metallopeptidase [Massilia sp. CF038]|uniref:M64 family metallopeptidase n=1 Tax=Massilia sp. CF038 TaxID=1881045 RepID=UPI00090F3FB1|nr:M64 family metallopeptidase [Massilia sp. CF038]SHG73530.1 IgA Peptidase M64 [Massilia sp. CF038]
MKVHPMWALLFLGLAGQAGLAQAENISLRVNFNDGRSGTSFTPVRAEVGAFGVTPNLPARAEGQHWRVVAKNAQGVILHEVAVQNMQQRHVEVFNPKTGKVDLAQTVKQAEGAFEVSLPFDKAVASVEVLPAKPASGNVRTMAAAGPAASFDRATLDKLVGAGKLARSQGMATALAAAATATTIIESGPAKTKMDYVFVGDGYTAAEMGKWAADAKKVIDGFMADPLFAANRGSMNVRRVDVASNQSGVDEPDRGIYRDTAMDGNFYCYNIERLLCVNNTKVLNIVGSVLAPDQRDVVIVISNSTRYGGSGGAVATLSMHASSVEVALHEIGHTAFALADEYDYGTCNTSSEPTEGDVSRVWSRSVKWGNLIAASTPVPTPAGSYPNGTVGTFQGAQYCTSGKYRPTENSRMRTLGYPWHAVNERLVKAVFAKYAPPVTGGPSQSGTLNNGSSVYAPNTTPGYITAGNGTITGQLTGAAGTDFELFLLKWTGSAWTRVASSTGPTSTESINYAGTAGYYYFEVKSYSGTGTYNLKYAFPPQ